SGACRPRADLLVAPHLHRRSFRFGDAVDRREWRARYRARLHTCRRADRVRRRTCATNAPGGGTGALSESGCLRTVERSSAPFTRLSVARPRAARRGALSVAAGGRAGSVGEVVGEWGGARAR